MRVSWFAARNPALRAVVIFTVLMGMFYGLVHTPAVGSERFAPYLAAIARISGWLLNLLAQEVEVLGPALRAPSFSAEIARGCDGLEPIAAFVAAVVASPLSMWLKLPGILAGTLFLWLINLVRIVSLMMIGIHFPRAFEVIHSQVWQAAFIVLAIVCWAVWVQWATRTKTVPTDAQA